MVVEPRSGRVRVVVVDDHLVVRRGLRALLDGEADIGVVGEAGDGEEALRVVDALHAAGRGPHVVLMDLQMAPVDGVEATRRIRARHAEVEVVALTAFCEPDRVQEALRAGAAGYLLKDVSADEVAGAIRAAHRGELQLDPRVARRLMDSLIGAPVDAAARTLTSRELDVLRLVAAGLPNKEIAAELIITERTARTHVSNILRKLGLASRTQAALWASRAGYGDQP